MLAPMSGRDGRWKRVAGVLFMAVLVPIVPFAIIGELPGERWLQASAADVLQFGVTGAVLLTLDVLLPIPSSIVGTMLGGRLGFAVGFGFAFTGLCAGQLIGYALGCLAPARWASELPTAPTLLVVFVSRPIPVLAEAIAIGAGVERVPFAPYVAAGAAGNALYAAVLSANGAALLPEGILGPGLIVPMLVPVLGYLAWRRLARAR